MIDVIVFDDAANDVLHAEVGALRDMKVLGVIKFRENKVAVSFLHKVHRCDLITFEKYVLIIGHNIGFEQRTYPSNERHGFVLEEYHCVISFFM